jgi:hypothetical protein
MAIAPFPILAAIDVILRLARPMAYRWRGIMTQDKDPSPSCSVKISPIGLSGTLGLGFRRESRRGVILFAHSSGSSRFSPRNKVVTDALRQSGFATLLFDLLTESEAADRVSVFDIALLAERLLLATTWVAISLAANHDCTGDDEAPAIDPPSRAPSLPPVQAPVLASVLTAGVIKRKTARRPWPAWPDRYH